MNPLESRRLDCPYCGADNAIDIDAVIGTQDYVEDCVVCCQPMQVHIVIDSEGKLETVVVQRQDD